MALIEKNLGKVAVTHKGQFDTLNQPYSRLDEVYGNNGTVSGSFRSLIDENSQPLSDTSAWVLISKNGVDGNSSLKTVNSVSDLSTKGSSDSQMYYVKANDTFYKYSATNPSAKSGFVAATDGFWIPQFYREKGNGVTFGNQSSIPSDSDYFNNAIVKVISQPGSNPPIVGFATDAVNVSGFAFVNIDQGASSWQPEAWWRGNTVPGEWTCESGIANRVLITGNHTKQMGFGVGCFITLDHTKFWTNTTPPFREDAILFWVSRHSLINQKSNHSNLDDVTDFYVTGHGHVYYRSAPVSGTIIFTTALTIAHQAATFVFKGSSDTPVILPDPSNDDVWGKKEYKNMYLEIVNLGTAVLEFDRPIRLDAGTTMTVLNNQYPDNAIKIKCVDGEWIKTT